MGDKWNSVDNHLMCVGVCVFSLFRLRYLSSSLNRSIDYMIYTWCIHISPYHPSMLRHISNIVTFFKRFKIRSSYAWLLTTSNLWSFWHGNICYHQSFIHIKHIRTPFCRKYQVHSNALATLYTNQMFTLLHSLRSAPLKRMTSAYAIPYSWACTNK